MKVFITKYAITGGIIEGSIAEAEIEKGSNHYVTTKDFRSHIPSIYLHTSKADAVNHAETLRELKLKSLRKQIAKIERGQF